MALQPVLEHRAGVAPQAQLGSLHAAASPHRSAQRLGSRIVLLQVWQRARTLHYDRRKTRKKAGFYQGAHAVPHHSIPIVQQQGLPIQLQRPHGRRSSSGILRMSSIRQQRRKVLEHQVAQLCC